MFLTKLQAFDQNVLGGSRDTLSPEIRNAESLKLPAGENEGKTSRLISATTSLVNHDKPESTLDAGIDINGLLEAAGIVNLPLELRQAAQRAFKHNDSKDHEGSHIIDDHPTMLADARKRLDDTLARAPQNLFGHPRLSRDTSMSDSSIGSEAPDFSSGIGLLSTPEARTGQTDPDILTQHLETSLRGIYEMYNASVQSTLKSSGQSQAEVDLTIRNRFLLLAQKVSAPSN